MFNIKETADTLKAKATEINKEVFEASEGIVDETLAAGQEWNKVLARTLKTGTYIFAQQQDLALTALEEAKKQYVTGQKRFRKLLGFKTAEKMIADVKEDIEEAVEDIQEAAEKTVNKAKKVLANTAKKTTTNKEVVKKVATQSKKTVKKATAKATDTKVVLASTVKKAPTQKVTTNADKPVAAAKKVLATTKKAAPAKTTSPVTNTAATLKDDLKVINGIGPKMEKVLNSAGILTYADLAAFNAEDLGKMLVNENPRYAMYEPKEWVEAAKKAVK